MNGIRFRVGFAILMQQLLDVDVRFSEGADHQVATHPIVGWNIPARITDRFIGGPVCGAAINFLAGSQDHSVGYRLYRNRLFCSLGFLSGNRHDKDRCEEKDK
jgi:hypothetical protein